MFYFVAIGGDLHTEKNSMIKENDKRLNHRLIYLVVIVLAAPIYAFVIGGGLPSACICFASSGVAGLLLRRSHLFLSVMSFILFAQLTIIRILNHTVTPAAIPDIAAFVDHSPIRTLSVVFPCANEGVFAVKSAQSMVENTNPFVLHEIIIVDDGSTTPLSTLFTPEDVERLKLKFVRHESMTGLINAKKAGGDAATGDAIAFLDCHVRPRNGWDTEIIQLLDDNYKRIVVPTITSLDIDTWDEISKTEKGIAKCYLTFDADFRWFDDEDNDDVPVMSGGLLVMTRRWWQETGGYDSTMKGWGGENIDQSLRSWLCGGEIVQARHSFVAHMWRVNEKPETKAKYIVPGGAVVVNRFKAISAWADEWVVKTLNSSDFRQFANVSNRPDISSITAVKDKLQCKPFAWFLWRFRSLYVDAGCLPTLVYHLRDARTNLCLARRPVDKNDGNVVAALCSDLDPFQYWHGANREGKKCCSGIRGWDSAQCLQSTSVATTAECTTIGTNAVQIIKLNSTRLATGDKCLDIGNTKGQPVTLEDCLSPVFMQQWTKREIPGDDVHVHILQPGTHNCLGRGGERENGNVEIRVCDATDKSQLFENAKLTNSNFAIFRNPNNECLDSASDTKLISYPCHGDGLYNRNQAFYLMGESGPIFSIMSFAKCLSTTREEVANITGIALAGCVAMDGHVKPGQKISRVAEGASTFKLSIGTDQCIYAVNSTDVSKGACSKDPRYLWEFYKNSQKLMNAKYRQCLDANDHKTPILYSCYDNENSNQEWEFTSGVLRNARSETCLDIEPFTERPVVTTDCDASRASWMRQSEFEPEETRLFKEALDQNPWIKESVVV